MMFARRNHGLIPISSLSSRRGRRPSRARRPSLGPERCEERMLLSTALVSLDAQGTAAANGNSDFSSPPYRQHPRCRSRRSRRRATSAPTARSWSSPAMRPTWSARSATPMAPSNVYVRDLTTGQTLARQRDAQAASPATVTRSTP